MKHLLLGQSVVDGSGTTQEMFLRNKWSTTNKVDFAPRWRVGIIVKELLIASRLAGATRKPWLQTRIAARRLPTHIFLVAHCTSTLKHLKRFRTLKDSQISLQTVLNICPRNSVVNVLARFPSQGETPRNSNGVARPLRFWDHRVPWHNWFYWCYVLGAS